MAENVGQINLGLDINKKYFDRQLRGISTHAEKRTKSLFSGIGKVMGVAIGASMITSFTKSSLALGSALTEVQNVVDTVFPSMNAQVNNFADTAMEQFGLSETVAKKYMGTLGAMSTSMGFTETAAFDMAKAVTGLAGDVASFYNLSTDEAYTKLKSIWTGETETLKDIGIMMMQDNLAQYALQKGYKKTYDAMNQQEKMMLRYEYVLSNLSNATGDFSKTSESWANQVRVLTLRYDEFKATIGQGLINLFTPMIQSLNTFISKLQVAAEYFKAFTEFISGTSNQTQSAAASNNLVSESMDNIGSSASDASKAINKSMASFDELNNLSETLSGSLNAASEATDGNIFGDYNIEPNKQIEDSLESTKKKIQDFAIEYKKELTILQGPTKDLTIAVKDLRESVSNLGETLFSKDKKSNWLTETFASQTAGRIEVVTGQIKSARGAVELLDNFLNGDFNNATPFETMISGLSETVLGFAKSIVPEEYASKIEEFQSKNETMWKNIKEHISKYGDESKLEFTDFLEFFKESFTRKLETSLPYKFYKMGKDIKDSTEEELEPFKKYFGEVLDALLNVAGEKLEKIRETWKTEIGLIKDNSTEDFSEVRDKLSQIWEGMKNTSSSIWSSIKNKVRTDIRSIINSINELITEYNNFEIKMPDLKIGNKTIEGFTWETPDIDLIGQKSASASDLFSRNTPSRRFEDIFSGSEVHNGLGGSAIPFSSGGIVSAPTLALVGDNRNASVDPEVIAPLSKLESMIAGDNNKELVGVLNAILDTLENKQMSISIGETEFGRVASKAINSYSRKIGYTPLKV